MNSAPFARLFGFVQKYRWLLTVLTVILQITVYGIDLWIFASRIKSVWTPLLEMASPWLLLPLLRRVFRAKGIQKTLESPYMALIAGYILVLSLLLVGFILAFQILNWRYFGQMHGGIFYYPALVLVFLWAIPPKRQEMPIS